MYIFPLVELLQVALHPNPVVSIGFQEEIIIDGKREEDVVLQIARRDMPKGAVIWRFVGRTLGETRKKKRGFVCEDWDDSTAVIRPKCWDKKWLPQLDCDIHDQVLEI